MRRWNNNGTNAGFAAPKASTSGYPNSSMANVRQPVAGPSTSIVNQPPAAKPPADDAMETDWGDDDDEEFLMATQITEMEQQLTPVPVQTEAEIQRIKEINEFALWNARHSESSQQLQLPNEEYLLLQNKIKELETAYDNLKTEKSTVQGEASILRKRLEEEKAQKQQDVFQKLKGIEEARKREADEKKRTRQEHDQLLSELQLAKIEIVSLRSNQSRRESLGRDTQSGARASSAAFVPTKSGLSTSIGSTSDAFVATQSQFPRPSTSAGSSKPFPTKSSFFANEVKRTVQTKEIQTDEVEATPVPGPSRPIKDIKSDVYKQLKRMLQEEAEREYNKAIGIVNSAVEAAPDAFAKDEPMTTVVPGRGIESIDPLLSVFHYLNLRDNDTFASDTCQQKEYLERKSRRFDMELIEARRGIESQEIIENSEEDSEGNELITCRDDYQVGDAYSASEDDSSDDGDMLPIQPTVLPAETPWSDSEPEVVESDDDDFKKLSKLIREEDNKRAERLNNAENYPYTPDPQEPQPDSEDHDAEEMDLEEIQVVPGPAPVTRPAEYSKTASKDSEDGNDGNDENDENEEGVQEIDDDEDAVVLLNTSSEEDSSELERDTKSKDYLSGRIHHSIRRSIISVGFLGTLNIVRTKLQKIVESVESADEGVLFLHRDKLLAFVDLMIWAKYLWRGISYERHSVPAFQGLKRSDWTMRLSGWTKLMILTVWRYFSSLSEIENLVRQVFLNTMGSILRNGFFDHTVKNYEELFLIIEDCLEFRPYDKVPCLISMLEILRYAARTSTTYKYLCRGANDGKCIAQLIGERAVEEFRQETQSSRDKMHIFEHYMSMVEVLIEPEECHPCLISIDDEEEELDEEPLPDEVEEEPLPDIHDERPSAKRRRTEHGSVDSPSRRSSPSDSVRRRQESKKHNVPAQQAHDMGIDSDSDDDIPLNYSLNSKTSWLHSSNWEAPPGTANPRCQCRKHLINNLLLVILDLWEVFEKEMVEGPKRLQKAKAALHMEGFTPVHRNVCSRPLSRALNYLIHIADTTEDIAVALGSPGFCSYWRLMAYYLIHTKEVCSNHQKTWVEELTYDPEDENPTRDTWGDEKWNSYKAKYPYLDPNYTETL